MKPLYWRRTRDSVWSLLPMAAYGGAYTIRLYQVGDDEWVLMDQHMAEHPVAGEAEGMALGINLAKGIEKSQQSA